MVKVLTLDQLKRMGKFLANRCYLCEEKEETMEHLLVHYQQVRMLWELSFAMVGTNLVFRFSIRQSFKFPFYICQTLISWQGAWVGKKCKKV